MGGAGQLAVLSHFVVYISILLCTHMSLGTSEEFYQSQAACELSLSVPCGFWGSDLGSQGGDSLLNYLTGIYPIFSTW